MKNKYLFTLIVCIWCSSFSLQAQNSNRRKSMTRQERIAKKKKQRKFTRRFTAGLMGGIVASQIDGDQFTGYDKRSLTGGIRVSTYLHHSLSFDVEFLYTKKGSKIEDEYNRFRSNKPKNRIIDLTYIDVPFLLTIKPNPETSSLFVTGGFALSRRIGTSITERGLENARVIYNDIKSEFTSTDITSVFGLGYYIGDDITIGLRLNYGLKKFYVNPNPVVETSPFFVNTEVEPIRFLRNYYASLIMTYNLF